QVSILLLGISVWIRMQMSESPAFKRMKEEGKTSKAPLSEAFGQWKNAKIALIALFGLTAGQAVVWYCGQFYALFFLQNVLKVENQSANIMVAIALLIGTSGFVFFGWLSDKIGRKPIIMAGLLLAAVTYFPLFKALTHAANPALAQAEQTIKATVTAAPGDCNFQFNATGTSKFTTSCDVATSFLAKSSVPYEIVQTAAAGTPATITLGDSTITSYDAVQAGADAAAKQSALSHDVNLALQKAGFPLVRDPAKVPDSKLDAFVAANPELQLNAEAIRGGEKAMVPAADLVKQKLLTQTEADGLGVSTPQAVFTIPGAGAFKMVADPAEVNWVLTIAILTVLVIYVTMVYGPIAAILVEMFPTRIRYTGMSLPYHIGNGWFGGLLPAGVFALSAAKGDIYYGLWYPIIIASITFVIGMIFVKETKGVDLHKLD
ncbi:MFS transporter, partial [Brucella intermedia 229E]